MLIDYDLCVVWEIIRGCGATILEKKEAVVVEAYKRPGKVLTLCDAESWG